MKATIIFYLFLLPLVFSCHLKNKLKDQISEDPGGHSSKSAIVGVYTDDNIRVYIYDYSKDSVRVELRNKVGYDGSSFTAFFSEKDGVYLIKATVKDVDENKSDYTFTFDSQHPNILTGNKQPKNPTPELQSNTYMLSRKQFVYSPSVGDYPEASQRLLVDSDVNNTSKQSLGSMRNEIYARHGYIFKNWDQRMRYEETDWYIPNSSDIKNALTDTEKKNIAYIKKFEKYARDDDFGR